MSSKFVVLVVLTCGVIFGVCEIKIAEVSKTLENTLEFLNEVENPSYNVTDAMKLGASELYLTHKTTPGLTADRKKMIDSLLEYFTPFLEAIEKHNTMGPEYNSLYDPKYIPSTINPKFKRGRIDKSEPLTLTLDAFLERNYNRIKSSECIDQLFQDNKPSLNLRQCQIKCHDEMYDTEKLDAGVPLSERIVHIFNEAMCNCSNDTPEKRIETITTYCNHMNRQLEAVEKQMSDSKFNKIYYYYIDNILMCGTWGFPEFYSEARIKTIIKNVNQDGSVGIEGQSEDEKAVLAAETAAILSSVIRLLTEEGS